MDKSKSVVNIEALFSHQIKTGSRESRRTTVPYFYNLCRQGVPMDVVDFPGIDDRDDSIPEMINLLFPLVQIVIFVVDYRYNTVVL